MCEPGQVESASPFVQIILANYDRSVWVFLKRAVLPLKSKFQAIGLSWISLDSLVRIETYQWVTADFRENNFSRGPSPALAGKRRAEAMRKRRIFHDSSLVQFLFFVN
jgi:hypothetical protein